MEDLLKLHEFTDVVDLEKEIPVKEIGGAPNSEFIKLQKKNLEQKLSPRMEVYSRTIRDHLREMKKTDDLTMTDYLLRIRALTDNLLGSMS